MPKQGRPLLFFYLIVFYVLLQLGWWYILLLNLNRQLIVEAHAGSPVAHELLRKKILMVSGEAVVFVALLVIGIIKVRSAFLKEISLSRQQSNFLLAVTHELKSPLSSARLYLQTLLKRPLPEHQQKQILEKVLQDNLRLEKLTSNLLLAARVEEPNFPVEPELLNAGKVVGEVVESLRPLYPDHQFIVRVDEDLHVRTDQVALTSILYNLAENAAKYSATGTEIVLTARKEKHTFVLEICDQGYGISKEDSSLIFSKFHRGGSEETRKSKGTGLGLFIVKHLVHQLGGEISFKSDSPGGTCFTVVLPVQQIINN